MTRQRIAKLIWLTSPGMRSYLVKVSGFDGCLDIDVPTTRVGNAIVRALRELAQTRPDLFPPSQQ